MKFYAADMHISVLSDAAHILRNLGHQVDDEDTLSGHLWVMPGKKKPCTLEHYGWNLQPDNIDRFYAKYKEKFDGYDGFIVAYPIALLKFWLKWNKPIICIICVRYEMPYTLGKEDWDRFSDVLRNHKQNKLFIHANSKGDRDYLEYYTGLKVRHITSLCEYVGLKHDPAKANDSFARFARNGGLDEVANTRGMPWGYKWEDLMACKAAVHIPFHQNHMSLFENYYAGLPIFVPSKRLMYEWRWGQHPVGVFSEINWYRVNKVTEPHDGSPNDLHDEKGFRWWADRCDFHDPEVMPHTIVFDSVGEYLNLQRSTNYAEVSRQMKAFNVGKREQVYAQWRAVIEDVKNCH